MRILKSMPYSFLSFSRIGNEGLLNGQSSVAGSLRMILVSYGSAEEGHDTIAPELVDGSLVPVDLIHQDTETAVHDLVDILRIELLGHGSEARHIREEDGHELPFTLDGAAGGKDLVGQKFGGVGSGLL